MGLSIHPAARLRARADQRANNRFFPGPPREAPEVQGT